VRAKHLILGELLTWIKALICKMPSYEFASSSVVLRSAASQDRYQGRVQDLEELRLEKAQGPLAASRCGPELY